MTKLDKINCLDVTRDFVDSVTECGVAIQIMGGVGSAVLQEVGAVFNQDARTVTPVNRIHLPQFRDDGNLRDLDVLVLTSSSEAKKELEALGVAAVAGRLELSVFGLHELSSLDEPLEKPLGKVALKTFVSDRYVQPGSEHSSENLVGLKALLPFAAKLDGTTETWGVETEEGLIPVPHPGATILNYLTRSVSGLRPKDKDKFIKLKDNVIGRNPWVAEWLADGPGAGQLALAEALLTLRSKKDQPERIELAGSLKIEAKTDWRALVEHSSFILAESESSTKAQHAALSLARIKARALHGFESNEKVVTLYQRYAESKMGSVLKNEN